MSNSKETVKTLMKQYTFLDSLNLIKNQKEIKIKTNLKNINSNSVEDSGVKTLLEQQLNKSQFEFFENEMLESIYKSTKNKSLGKSRQSTSKPENVTNVSQTFGIKSKMDCKLYEVILPPISPRSVLWNSQKGHNLYVKTHQHYNPSERIKRPYCSEVFNPCHTFEKHYKVNFTGQGVKNSLNNYCFDDRVISKIQGELKYEKCDQGRKEIVTPKKEMIEKNNLNQEIAYLNSLRVNLKKRKMIFMNLIKFVKNDNVTNDHLTTIDGLINSLSKQNIFINFLKIKQILDKFEIYQDTNQIKQF